MTAVLLLKLLHCSTVIRQTWDKKLSIAQRRYKHHHDRRVRAKATLIHGQWVYTDCPLLAVTATDCLETDSYS